MCSRPRSARQVILAALLCWSCCLIAEASDREHSYLAALESINADDLMRHIDYLADDDLEGREPGTPGGQSAGDYLQDRLRELHLEGAGIDGGFIQPFDPNYRNILAILPGSDPELKHQTIVIGAHYDHLGYGTRRNSYGPIGFIHNGADDNASGTSAVLELAEALTMLAEPPARSIVLAFWDAEEKGLLGSRHWVANPTVPLEDVVLTINVDMVGRLRDELLTVFGTRSGYGLRRLVSGHNEGLGLRVDFSWKMEANADHHPFFQRQIPYLLWHTGMHDQYHTPYDDVELIDPAGASRVTRLLFHVAYDLATRPELTGFRGRARRETERTRERLAAQTPQLPSRLGVSWRREDGPGDGVRLARVVAGSPAEEAGLLPGDRILEFAGREIRSGDDLSGAVIAAENPATLVARRAGSPEPLTISVELDGSPLRLGITWRVDDAEPGTIILTYVVPGSPAARAGLTAGERIYQIGGRDFADQEEFANLASTLTEPLELLVERDGQLRTVMLYIQTEPLKQAA
jgi:hypothetical protein